MEPSIFIHAMPITVSETMTAVTGAGLILHHCQIW